MNAIVKLHQSDFLNPAIRSSGTAFRRVEDGFDHVASQLKAAKNSVLALEKKIENSLALVDPKKHAIYDISTDLAK